MATSALYVWVEISPSANDFGDAIFRACIREGMVAVTAKVIWWSAAVVKPSYGAVKMLTY